MLLAERGKFDEAISLFEAAEKDHLLSAADYRVLADWYLVSNRREAYERSQVEAFKMVPEQYLNNMFSGLATAGINFSRFKTADHFPPNWMRTHCLPCERLLKNRRSRRTICRCCVNVRTCRDFRLLQMLPHAVVGRSPQQIYPFLATLQFQILGEIDNEATTDEIIATIKKLRVGKLTSTDLRALDLFEAIIERRASEVLNAPGPHNAACLAALRRAFHASGVMASRG